MCKEAQSRESSAGLRERPEGIPNRDWKSILWDEFFWNSPKRTACKAKTLPEDNLHESEISAWSPTPHYSGC